MALAAVCLASFLRELLTFILGWAGILLLAKPKGLLGLPACPKPPKVRPAGGGPPPAVAKWQKGGPARLFPGPAMRAGGPLLDGAGLLASLITSSSWLHCPCSTAAAVEGAKSPFCASAPPARRALLNGLMAPARLIPTGRRTL